MSIPPTPRNEQERTILRLSDPNQSYMFTREERFIWTTRYTQDIRNNIDRFYSQISQNFRRGATGVTNWIRMNRHFGIDIRKMIQDNSNQSEVQIMQYYINIENDTRMQSQLNLDGMNVDVLTEFQERFRHTRSIMADVIRNRSCRNLNYRGLKSAYEIYNRQIIPQIYTLPRGNDNPTNQNEEQLQQRITQLENDLQNCRIIRTNLEQQIGIHKELRKQLEQENTNLRQALEMVMTQSQTEFDKTAVIIEYTRQTQILQDMFLEQRRVLSQQLEQLTGINIPGSRSITQFTIALMINRIKRYFDKEEIEKIIPSEDDDIPQTHINTSQNPINLNLSGTTDEIFKQFYPKKQK